MPPGGDTIPVSPILPRRGRDNPLDGGSTAPTAKHPHTNGTANASGVEGNPFKNLPTWAESIPDRKLASLRPAQLPHMGGRTPDADGVGDIFPELSHTSEVLPRENSEDVPLYETSTHGREEPNDHSAQAPATEHIPT